MKLTILLMTLLTFYSCNFDKKSVDNRNNEKYNVTEIDSTYYMTNLLIGEWEINAEIHDNVEADCNECPKIKFKNELTAIVIFPTGETEKIEWIVNNKLLILTTNENVNVGKIFTDNQYEMTFTHRKDFIELKLSELNNKNSILLRR